MTLAPPGVNLSLGKIATASSTQDPVGLAAGLAIDGDSVSRWDSQYASLTPAVPTFNPDNQWILVDLGAVMQFNRVILQWDPAYASSYVIQVSNDKSTWKQIYQQTSGVGGKEDFTFTTTLARYVCMQGVTPGSQYAIR